MFVRPGGVQTRQIHFRMPYGVKENMETNKTSHRVMCLNTLWKSKGISRRNDRIGHKHKTKN